MSAKGVSESRFHMWRAVFALSHADHVVTDEEQRFMFRALASEDFSQEQKDILEQDMRVAQDPARHFTRITDQRDRTQFFYFARMLLWSDGDFAKQEQEIVTALEKVNLETADIDAVYKNMGLTLEEEQKDWLQEDMKQAQPQGSVWQYFLDRFRG